MTIFINTILALVAFAGNSVLCRFALGDNLIDASSFTSIRLLAGIVMLVSISYLFERRSLHKSDGSWQASIFLFIYAAAFSFAYIYLDTGTGALILFTAVQLSMILIGIFLGNQLNRVEWFGLIAAFFGFVYLISPGITAPSLEGFLLMSVAGIAWGCYTLKGKASTNPLADTTGNFVRTLPFVALLVLMTYQNSQLSTIGVALAVVSGGLASGVGYTIWYSALKGLTTVRAAVVQLSVPIIAAIGGAIFVNEGLSLRFVISSVVILGGILTVILARGYGKQTRV
ncbi:MAG: DMT family transporter [Pseudomonadota bacterium]